MKRAVENQRAIAASASREESPIARNVRHWQEVRARAAFLRQKAQQAEELEKLHAAARAAVVTNIGDVLQVALA